MPDLYKTLQKFYDGLGNEEEFKTRMQNEEDRKSLYDSMKENGIDTKGYEEFAGYETQQTPVGGEASGNAEGTVVGGQGLNQIQPGTNSTRVGGDVTGQKKQAQAQRTAVKPQQKAVQTQQNEVKAQQPTKNEAVKEEDAGYNPEDVVTVTDGQGNQKQMTYAEYQASVAEYEKQKDAYEKQRAAYDYKQRELEARKIAAQQKYAQESEADRKQLEKLNARAEGVRTKSDSMVVRQTADMLPEKFIQAAYEGKWFGKGAPKGMINDNAQSYAKEHEQEIMDKWWGIQQSSRDAYIEDEKKKNAATIGAYKQTVQTQDEVDTQTEATLEQMRKSMENQLLRLHGKVERDVFGNEYKKENGKKVFLDNAGGEHEDAREAKAFNEYYRSVNEAKNVDYGQISNDMLTVATDIIRGEKAKESPITEAYLGRFNGHEVKAGEKVYAQMAKDIIEDSQTLLRRAAQENEDYLLGKFGGFIAGSARGLYDSVFDLDAWLDNYASQKARAQYDVYKKIENEEELTPGEQVLADAMALNLAVTMQTADELGWGYKSGQTTGASLPFMLNIALTGGISQGATKGAAKGISKGVQAMLKRAVSKYPGMFKGALGDVKEVLSVGKNLLGKFSNTLVGKGLKASVGAVATGAVQTALTDLPKVAANAAERMTGTLELGQKEDGTIGATGVAEKAETDDAVEAFTKSFVANVGEQGSEVFGNTFIEPFEKHLGKWIGGMMKPAMESLAGSKLGKYIAETGAAKYLSQLGKLTYKNKWSDKAKEISKAFYQNGLFNEYLEEVANNVWSAATTGDTTWAEVVDPKKNAETLVGLMWTSGVFGAVGAYGRVKAYKKGMRALNEALNPLNRTIEHDDVKREAWEAAYNKMLNNGGSIEVINEALKEFQALNDVNTPEGRALNADATKVAMYVAMIQGVETSEAAEDAGKPMTAGRQMEKNATADALAAQTHEEMQQVTSEMDAAEEMLAEVLPEGTDMDEYVKMFGDTPGAQYDAVSADEGLTPEQKKALLSYIDAKARFDVMIEGSEGEIEERVKAAQRRVQEIMHEDGNVYQVHRGEGEIMQDGVIISGNVNDLQSVVQVRMSDGTLEQIKMGDLVVDMVRSGEEAMAAEAEAARQEAILILSGKMDIPEEDAEVAEAIRQRGREGVEARSEEYEIGVPDISEVTQGEATDIQEDAAEVQENAIEAQGSVATPQIVMNEEGGIDYQASGVEATVAAFDSNDRVSDEGKQRMAEKKAMNAQAVLNEARAKLDEVRGQAPVEDDFDDPFMAQQAMDAYDYEIAQAQEAVTQAEDEVRFWDEVGVALAARSAGQKYEGMISEILDSIDEDSTAADVEDVKTKGGHVAKASSLEVGVNYEGKRIGEMNDSELEDVAKQVDSSARELREIDAIARTLGVNIGFADYLVTEDGQSLSNAQVDARHRTILVSRRSLAGGKSLSFLLGHEFTHQMRDNNDAKISAFMDEVKRLMGGEYAYVSTQKQKFYRGLIEGREYRRLLGADAAQVLQLVNRYREQYGGRNMVSLAKDLAKESWMPLTEEQILDIERKVQDTVQEEIAADFAGELLMNAEFRNKVSGLSRTWKEKIADFIDKLMQRIGGYLTPEERQMLDDLENMWMNAEKTSWRDRTRAIANGGNTMSKRVGNSSVVMKDGYVRYNVVSRRDEKALLDAVLQTNAGRLNRQELEDMKKIGDAMMEGVVGMMAKHPAFAEWNERVVIQDKEGKPAYTAFINNSDTEAPTIELSRNCVKKEAINSLLTLLRHEGLLGGLNNVNYQDLREVLKKHGYAIACKMCYVEAKRENVELKKKLADAWNSIAGRAGLTRENFMIAGAQELTDKQEAVLRSIVDKYGKNKREGKIANLMLEYPELRGTMDHEYMYTPEGWDEIVQKFGDEHAFLRFLASSDGAATAKPTFGSQPFSQRKFLDQFSELSQYFGEAGIKFGGFRKHSFSDADPLLFVDDFQIHENLAATQSGMFGYTKVPYYVDMWGETGEFINESLVLDIDTEREGARESAGLIEVGDPRHQKGLGLTDEEYEQYKKENGLKDGDMDYYFAEESFPVRQAFAFRNEARFGGRVGTVLVATSDAVIEKALDDDRIDIIIGYHVSNKTSANKQRAGYHLATDYAGIGTRPPKNETVGNKGKITSKTYLPSMGVIAPTYLAGSERDKYVKFNYNEACQQYGDAKTAAKAYLEWCDENGFTPMYEKFRGHENYYKLLNDFRRYDGDGKPLVQGAIKMQLPEDWAEKLDGYLTEREAEHEKNTSLALNKELLDDVREIMGVKKGRSYSVNEGIYDSGLNSEENPLKDAEKAVPLRGAQWWLTPGQREASREKHKNDGNMKLKDLAFLSDASKEGVKFTYDELIAIPEIAEAQAKLDRELQEKGSLDLKEAGLDAQQFVDKLLDEEHGSFTGKKEITTENGEKKKVEMFDGEVAQERKAFFVIGRPAGGKSSVYANPLSRDNKARIVDSDVVKPWLPGFDGGDGAGYVNKASSDIAEVAVWQSAERGDNMVIPKIGGDSVLKDAIKLKMYGYKVYLYYNDVPAEASYTRSMARYAETGRYLSLNYLKDGVGEKPSKTFHNSTGSVIDVVRYLASKESKDRGYWENYLNELENGRRNVQDAGVQDVRRTGRMASGQQHGSRDESLRGVSGEASRLFEYVEWKSNDVGLGQDPRLVWSTESGVPMPETAEVGNDYYERTNQFKGFFGDWEKDPEHASKVVDENGKPLVLHHGTPHYGYTVFDTRKNRAGETTMGSHFGSQDAAEDRLASKRTGKDVGIYDVYLNIRNPWECTDWFDMNDSWAMADLAKLALEHKDNAKVQDMWNILKRFESWAGKYTDEELSKAKFYDDGIKGLESYKEYDMGTFHNFARYMIEAAGYDGIKYWNDAEGSGYSWVVFSPEQIKSAEMRGKMANNGNYDSRTEGRKDDIRYSVNEASPVRKDGEGVLEYGQRVADWDEQKKLISEATKEQAEDAGVRYSIVEDPKLKKELDESKKVRVYRAMQVINGKLYPPMAAMVDGEYVEPTEIGTWYESDERPDLAKNGKFRLNKGNGKYVDAAYNPYFHSTTFPLNDQFKEAQNRPNLVVVEMEVPEYEAYPEKYADRERYKAEGAKDAVGALDWKAGDVQSQLTGTREVILTKHARVTGVLKPEEWAELVAPTLKENNVTMPSNVVTPEQRAVLESYGIPFVETNNRGELTQGEFAGEQYTWHYGKDAEKKRAEGLKKREKASEKKAVRYGADGVGTRGADVKYSVIGELGADEEKKRSLEMAKEMEKAKKRPLTIKKATGWERGADGKWRYEIGDLPVDESLLKDMKNNFFAYENQEDGLSTHQWLKKYGRGYGLSDLIAGSELLEDYPELGNVAVFVAPTNVSAYTAVDLKTGKPAFIVLNGMFDADYNIGSLNHEVQHVIQAYENFAYGAMPKDGGYRETAGEVEARNVRERMGMTDANRRSTLLSKTEDVDRADQNIVSFEQYLEDGRRKLGIAADDRKYSVDEGANDIKSKLEKRGKELYENIKPSAVSDFGNVYEGLEGEPNDAVALLAYTKEGEVPRALFHSSVGEIDLVWGNEGTGKSDGYGLAKILKYHPEVAGRLQEILDDMHEVKRSSNRVMLESDTHKAGIRLTWNGKAKKWLITEFEKSEATTKTSDTDGNREDLLSDTALQQTSDYSVGKDKEFTSNEQGNEEKVAQENAELQSRGDNESLVDYAERMVDRQEKEKYDKYGRETLTKYSVADPFYSNAARGLESLQQKKATGEQWLAMLKNKGFLKAEEDEWSGLGEWLRSQKGSVTKEEVANYIVENTVKLEDWTYSEEAADIANNERMQALQSEFEELVWQGDEATGSIYTADWREWAYEQMIDRYGDDFRYAFEYNNKGELEPTFDYRDELSGEARYFLGLDGNNDKPINGTRLDYTTQGLQNKREIALVVPTIAPYNENDEVHFGDAGEGRAVAWLRFGDAYDMDGKKVLVIDEVQSKRHQDGRENGYESQYASSAKAKFQKASEDMREWQKRMREKHGNFYVFDDLTEEERKEYNELYAIMGEASQYDSNNEPLNNVPDAPFKKNWMELAMKRALRYAAENGYDKVAWTSGEQQSKRYDIGGKVMSIDVAKVTVDDMTGEPVDSKEYFVYTTDTDGDLIYEAGGRMDAKKMESIFGKDIASKMIAQADEANGESVTIDGGDLHVGGEGMKGFYDKMIPSFMNKYCKKWGTQTGEVELSSVERAASKMHAVDVTDSMKESVMNGQPMYSVDDGRNRSIFRPSERSKCREWRQAFRELYGDDHAIDLLRDDHPRDIVEVASEVIYSNKLLWDDEGDGQYRKKGVRSMLGWSKGERAKFANLFRTSLNGGLTVQQMGERVEDMCRAEGVQFDDTDANAGLNAVIEVLRGSRNSSDIRNWIDLRRVDEAREYHEGWVGEFEYDRDQYYLDRYGMDFDEYMDYMESLAPPVQPQGTKKTIGAAPVRDNTERPVMPLREPGESIADYVIRTAGVEKAQRDWDKTHYVDEQTDVMARNIIINHIKENLKADDVKEVDKITLTSMMRVLSNTNPKNLGQMLDEARGIVNHIAMKAQRKRIENLLKMKMQGRDQKNRSVSANVDDTTRKIFAGLQETLKSVRTTGLEDDMHALRSKIWHVRVNAARENRELTEEELDSINSMKEELRDLQEQQSEVWKDLSAQGQVDVEAQLKHYEDMYNDPEVTMTDEDIIRMTQLTIAERIVAGEKALAEGFDLGVELKKARLAHQKAIEDGKKEGISEEEHLQAEQQRKMQLERIRGIERLIIQSQSNYLDAMKGVEEMLSDLIEKGRENLLQEKMEERERKREVLTGAYHDLTGDGRRTERQLYGEKTKDRSKTPWWKRPFTPALSSFEYMARNLGTRSLGNESFFYKRFVSDPDTGVMAANAKFVDGMTTWMRMLDDKCKEIFGGKDYRTVWDANSKVNQHTGVYRTIDVDGNYDHMEEMEISKDTAMYLYMLWQMEDGQAKLLNMGIDGETISQCISYAGMANIELCDWMQQHFLNDLRTPVNETYKKIYHTSMAEIENYVPIKIASSERKETMDFTITQNEKGDVQVSNGALINRTVNVLGIDLSRGAMDVVAEHLNKQMEFVAYAQIRQELGWVMSSAKFRNRMEQNKKGSFNRLLKATQIALHAYSPNKQEMDDLFAKYQKGLVGGNIAFRNTTALKQMLSAPAYLGYSQSPKYLAILAKNMGLGYLRNSPTVALSMVSFGAVGKVAINGASGKNKIMRAALSDNMRWCIENVPNFRQRVLRGDAGEIHLDEKGFGKLLDDVVQFGMTNNQLIDAITCSIGIKSIYDYKMAKVQERIDKMIKDGEEIDAAAMIEAEHRKAIIEATIFYNATQQSNDAAFMSPLQVDKTFLARTLTLYKNSPTGYARKMVEGIQDVRRYLDGQTRRNMINSYADELIAQGYDEAKALKEAKEHVNTEIRKRLIDVGLFGIVMNGIWNIGGIGFLGWLSGRTAAQLLLGGGGDGDDDDPTLMESVAYLSSLPMNGVPGGDLISYCIQAIANKDKRNLSEFGSSIIGQETVRMIKQIGKTVEDSGMLSKEFTWLVFQKAGRYAGLNPEVIVNTALAVTRMCEDGWQDGDEAVIDIMLFLQSPESNRAEVAKNLFVDNSHTSYEYFAKVMKAMKYVQGNDFYPSSKKISDKAKSDLVDELGKRILMYSDKKAYDTYKQFRKDLDAVKTGEEAWSLVDKYGEVMQSGFVPEIEKKIKELNKKESVPTKKGDLELMYKAVEKAKGNNGYESAKRQYFYRIATSDDLKKYEALKDEKKSLGEYGQKYSDLYKVNTSKADVYYKNHKEEIDRYYELNAVLDYIDDVLKDLYDNRANLNYDDDSVIKELRENMDKYKSRHK